MPILYQNINLKSLYFFTVVVESGGFSQAEKKLYVSAGTVSNHMDVLEKNLRVSFVYPWTSRICIDPKWQNFL